MVLYWLVGHIERVSWGCSWLYWHFFFTTQACIFCFVQSLRFNCCTYYTFHQTLFLIFPILITNSIGSSALANIRALLDALALSTAGVCVLQTGALFMQALWQRRSLVL